MRNPARFELSPADVLWLREMDAAMERPPEPMVSAVQYQAVVDSRDAAVRAIHRMRANRKRLWRRYLRLRGRLCRTEWAAAAVIGILVVWKW